MGNAFCADCSQNDQYNTRHIAQKTATMKLKRNGLMPGSPITSQRANRGTELSQEQVETLVELVRKGLDNSDSFLKDNVQLVNQFVSSKAIWKQVLHELAKIYQLDIFSQNAVIDDNYITAIKRKRFYRVVKNWNHYKNQESKGFTTESFSFESSMGSQSRNMNMSLTQRLKKGKATREIIAKEDMTQTFILITQKGVVSVSRSAAADWEWKGHSEYWPLEYHKKSLFQEAIPHLKQIFFFRPIMITHFLPEGTYRVYLRQAVDPVCNLMGKGTIFISLKQAKLEEDEEEFSLDRLQMSDQCVQEDLLGKSFLQDKDYVEVAQVEFIREDHFNRLFNANGNLVDIELGVFDLKPKQTQNQIATKQSLIEGSPQKEENKSFLETDQSPQRKSLFGESGRFSQIFHIDKSSKKLQDEIEAIPFEIAEKGEKYVQVKVEVNSFIQETKEGWWVDSLIFEPVIEQSKMILGSYIEKVSPTKRHQIGSKSMML